MSEEVFRRFVPEVPDGYVPLAEAAQRLGLAWPDSPEPGPYRRAKAIQVTQGKSRGLRIELGGAEQRLLTAVEGEQAA